MITNDIVERLEMYPAVAPGLDALNMATVSVLMKEAAAEIRHWRANHKNAVEVKARTNERLKIALASLQRIRNESSVSFNQATAGADHD